MSKEIWRSVEGYEQYYLISNLGTLKSKKTGSVINPWKTYQGYLQVELSFIKPRKKFYLHRLVAKAFIENPNNEPAINHINSKRSDNRVENLEWVSISVNNSKAKRLPNFIRMCPHCLKEYNYKVKKK
jgi:hypothetical protein